MNDDIVERVRQKCFVGEIPQDSVETCLEAADEIEELRYKISKLKDMLYKVIEKAYRG